MPVLLLLSVAAGVEAKTVVDEFDDSIPGQSSPMDGRLIRSRIVSVADGDTVTVRAFNNREIKVRLVSVDSPETHFLGKSQGPAADLAEAKLKEMLPVGTEVVIKVAKNGVDQYGRTLGYVMKEEKGQIINVNFWLVNNCYAVNYLIYPNVEGVGYLAKSAYDCMLHRQGIYDPRLNLEMLPYEFRNYIRQSAPSRYCGDIKTKIFYRPLDYRRVDAPFRVFFVRERDALEAGFKKGFE